MVAWYLTGLVITAGFGVLSAVLLRAPPLQWTRRKRPWPHDTRRIAHRGGSMIGPENTLLTFRRALATGAVDMLELDVCLTADGVVVVAHDASLTRNCGVPRGIPETTFAELPKTARRIPLHFTAPETDVWAAGEEEWAAEGPQALPTLREVFEAFPSVPMHIDAKYQSAELAAKTVALVREFGREDISIVGSARRPSSGAVRRLAQHPAAGQKPIRTFASAEDVLITYLLYYLGLLPFVSVSYDAFDIPLPTAHLRQAFGRPALVWLLNAPKLWAHLRRRGVRVYGFVVNCAADMEEAREWPVDGIMSDDPRLFRNTPWLAPRDC